jgi:hypothetical protein
MLPVTEKVIVRLGNSSSCINDLAQFKPAFNGVLKYTTIAVSANIETEQITNGNLKLKGNSSFAGRKGGHDRELPSLPL